MYCFISLLSTSAKDALQMIVEDHDCQVIRDKSTLLGRVGMEGSVEYPYQAELWVKNLMGGTNRRIYVYDTYLVFAVFSESGPRYRAPEWTGEWRLESASPYRNIATAFCGPEQYHLVHNLDEADAWAKLYCLAGDVGTAVVLDKDGVLLAYERGPEGPVLVAKGPRPLPLHVAA